MKKHLPIFLAGMLSMALIGSIVVPAIAAGYQKQATLDYPGIKITLDDNIITPTDANGNVVEPFAIEGTTYLPVRGIASALGLGVDWNQSTQTVKLSSTPGGAETVTTDFPEATLSTSSDITKYLKEYYSELDTTLGHTSLYYLVRTSYSELHPYDYQIRIKVDSDFYLDFMTSSDEIKNQTLEEMKAFAKTIVYDLAEKLPGIKLQGYYCETHWKYPTIMKDEIESEMGTWINYSYVKNPIADNYDQTSVGDFAWYPQRYIKIS